MLKDGENKLKKEQETKKTSKKESKKDKKSFRRYSPQLQRVVEAKDYKEWKKIVEEEIHGEE